MAELPQNTIEFLASIGCTVTRIADDAWIIRDTKTKTDSRAIFNGATIDSATKFPSVIQQ